MRAPQPAMGVKPLTPRQANALQLTLDGHTKGEICERLGITQATLWRWRKLPAWNEEVSVVLRDASGDGQGQIKSMLPLATRRLKQLIVSTTESVALGACRTVLEAHANLVAREEQQQMLAELEQQLEALQVEVAAARPTLLAEAPIEADFTDSALDSALDPAPAQEAAQ